MLVPKRAKFRKQFRGSMAKMDTRGAAVNFGEFGLKAMSTGWITSRQIEAARKAMTHHTKRGGRIWIRIFPDKPITKKLAETRMGGGKGDVSEYVAVVKTGRILFEIGSLSKAVAIEAMRLAGHKLPIKTRFVERA